MILKKNHQSYEHISHKTQKCKGLHSTIQAEIMNINSLLYLQIQKVLGAYSDITYYDTIVKYHDAATWCAFFTNVRIIIKITSTSQTAQGSSNHF